MSDALVHSDVAEEIRACLSETSLGVWQWICDTLVMDSG